MSGQEVFKYLFFFFNIDNFPGENRNLENKNDPHFYCSRSPNPGVGLSLAKDRITDVL